MLERRLTKKIGIYFVGMFASKIFPFLLIPIYAFYVSSESLGYYDLIHTVMGIAKPFLYVAIWEAILRFVLSERNYEIQKNAITSSAIFVLLVSIFIFVCTFFLDVSYKTYDVPFILIGVMYISHSVAFVWQYYARALEFNKFYVYAGIIGTIVNFVFVILLNVILKLELKGLIISYILGQLSIFIFLEVKIKILRYISLSKFNVTILKEMLLFSSPLVLNLTSSWLISSYGRFLIINRLGAEANGLFSFASRFSVVISMIGSVVTMAMIEEAIITAKTTGFNSKFRETIENIFRIFLSISIISVPLIVIFYSFIQNSEFYSSYKYAPWLLIFSVSSTLSSNIGSVFQAISKTKYQFITTVIGAFVTVILSSLLINKVGIYAIIVGQVFGSISMLLSRYFFVNKYVNLRINWIPIINMSMLFIIVTLLCLNLKITMILILLPIVLSLVGYFNRNFLYTTYNTLKQKIVR